MIRFNSRRLATALLLFSCTGCFFRLSDPVYAFKGIHASEPDEEGQSLVFGSLQLEGFLTGTIDTVVLRRVSPHVDAQFHVLTEQSLFRVFQRRPMKNGNFVMTVDPGAYEIVEVSSSSWFNPQIIKFGETARVASRFSVTRPGVYDLGVVRLKSAGTFSSYYEGTHERGDAAHESVLRSAVEGTSWERFLKGGA